MSSFFLSYYQSIIGLCKIILVYINWVLGHSYMPVNETADASDKSASTNADAQLLVRAITQTQNDRDNWQRY